MRRSVSANPHDRPLLALAIRLFGVLWLAVLAVFIKLAADSGIHLVEIMFWRQFLSIPILLAWGISTHGWRSFATARPKDHAVRTLYGIAGMALNFGAIILLPLAEATALTFSAPIFAVLLSIVLLRESVGFWRWSAVAAGFAGVLVIAQPGGNHVPLAGAAVALGAAFMIALISIQVRDLGRTEQPIVIVFWFAVGGSLVVLPALPFVHQHLSAWQWLLLLGIGLSGTFAQILITFALKIGQVSSVIVMDYSNLVWATLFGWLVFATVPPLSTWLGAPLVVAAGVIITWREQVLRKRKLAATTPVQGT